MVITVPLALANEGPKTLTEPPIVGPLQRSADDGVATANQGADDANAEAQSAQAQVSRAKHGAIAQTQAGVGEGAKILEGVLGAAQDAADQVGEFLRGLTDGYVPPDHQSKDGPTSWKPSTSDSQAVTSEAAAVPAALAMVVAAGAVGGALLWWTVAQRLVMFGIIPLLSRIAHSEIYTNDARRLIADLAVHNPGLSLNELVARTGYSRNAVSYHLFVLEKEEELVSIKDGKYRRYFPRGGKYVNGAKNVVSALRNDTTLKMAQHVVHFPGSIQREICRLLGTTASAACWHAKRLEDLHVIRKERVANTVQYFPGDALRKYDLSEFGLGLSPGPAAAPVEAGPSAPAATPTAP